MTKLLTETVFWFHFLIGPAAFISVFVLPPIVFLSGLVAWGISLKVFNGCVVTQVQKKYGLMPKDITFTQWWLARLFRVQTSHGGIKKGTLVVAALAVFMSAVRLFA